MRIKTLALIGASFLILATSSAEAQIAYTNGGIDGTISGWTINSGYALTNSFTLSSTTTITGFTFGGWTFAGDTITSVDWGISSSVDYAISGTASLAKGSGGTNGFGYDVYEYGSSIAPLTLAAGTYYFGLQNAGTSQGNLAFWDVNNGPSVAFENQIGNVNGYLVPGTNSAAFTLLSGSVPEPASWALMLGGFGLVGGAMRRRRASVSFA